MQLVLKDEGWYLPLGQAVQRVALAPLNLPLPQTAQLKKSAREYNVRTGTSVDEHVVLMLGEVPFLSPIKNELKDEIQHKKDTSITAQEYEVQTRSMQISLS